MKLPAQAVAGWALALLMSSASAAKVGVPEASDTRAAAAATALEQMQTLEAGTSKYFQTWCTSELSVQNNQTAILKSEAEAARRLLQLPTSEDKSMTLVQTSAAASLAKARAERLERILQEEEAYLRSLTATCQKQEELLRRLQADDLSAFQSKLQNEKAEAQTISMALSEAMQTRTDVTNLRATDNSQEQRDGLMSLEAQRAKDHKVDDQMARLDSLEQALSARAADLAARREKQQTTEAQKQAEKLLAQKDERMHKKMEEQKAAERRLIEEGKALQKTAEELAMKREVLEAEQQEVVLLEKQARAKPEEVTEQAQVSIDEKVGSMAASEESMEQQLNSLEAELEAMKKFESHDECCAAGICQNCKKPEEAAKKTGAFASAKEEISGLESVAEALEAPSPGAAWQVWVARWQTRLPGAANIRWQSRRPGAAKIRWQSRPPGAAKIRWQTRLPGSSKDKVAESTGKSGWRGGRLDCREQQT
eukprot:TRINITY_DN5303_c0_g1_i11.p1 TRINITY_DN5303_c0_g1~~TRINITY_DN5303_c0_g1_i11.p1  ORF type:complete len:481 (+),score=151.83 TRINITY_DN5303_c0_g1_i11:149-1591(+)